MEIENYNVIVENFVYKAWIHIQITELINSYIDMKQSKTDAVIQQNELTGKLSGNESISLFYEANQEKEHEKHQ